MQKQYTNYYSFEAKSGVSDTGVFEGYASTFNNVDLQGDIVQPGAFTATLKKSRGIVPILMAHSSGRPVGYGLEAAEDEKGLWVKGQFTVGSDDGRNAYETIKHAVDVGHKFGLSIGYRIPDKGSEWDESTGVRKLKKIDLLEYSLAAVPANPQARVTGVKSDSEWTIREFEKHLRDVGFSVQAARTITSRGFAAIDPRDADDPPERATDGGVMAEVRKAAFFLELKEGFNFDVNR